MQVLVYLLLGVLVSLLAYGLYRAWRDSRAPHDPLSHVPPAPPSAWREARQVAVGADDAPDTEPNTIPTLLPELLEEGDDTVPGALDDDAREPHAPSISAPQPWQADAPLAMLPTVAMEVEPEPVAAIRVDLPLDVIEAPIEAVAGEPLSSALPDLDLILDLDLVPAPDAQETEAGLPDLTPVLDTAPQAEPVSEPAPQPQPEPEPEPEPEQVAAPATEVAVPSTPVHAPAAVAPIAPAVPSGPPLILVVDDSAVVRAKMVKLLKSVGYETEVAKNGVQALALIPQLAPRVVVTDIEMPEMDGYELIARLDGDASLRTIPVCAVSSFENLAERLAEHTNVKGCFGKPWDDAVVVSTLSDLVEVAPAQS